MFFYLTFHLIIELTCQSHKWIFKQFFCVLIFLVYNRYYCRYLTLKKQQHIFAGFLIFFNFILMMSHYHVPFQYYTLHYHLTTD